ncbi:MAG TPA: ABC transporter ATP-binding protein [Gemmataceae bacterium]|nr:ABC transporter ATP-binding protein [Gemmataceae bacterium]
MKNFLRGLRCAWPYRGRLMLSLACALVAAILWGMTFTAVSPVLKILDSKRNLQAWLDDCLSETQNNIALINSELRDVNQEFDALNNQPETPMRNKWLRDVTLRMHKLESDLRSASFESYVYQLIKWRCVRFLPEDPFETLVWVMSLVVFGVLIRGIFEFWQESLVGSVVNLSLFDLRNRLYRNVIHLDVNNFSEEGTGELMARFTNDMETLGNGLKTLFGKVVAEPLKAIVCVLLACWFSWQLTLMFLVLVPVAAFILMKIGRLMKRATRRLLERMSSIYKILQESFQGIRVVKAFTMEPYERRRFCSATKDYYHKAMWMVNLDALTDPIIEFLGLAAIAGGLLAGAYLVLRNATNVFGIPLTSRNMTHESLFNLFVLLASIADPVRKLSSVYTRIQSGAAAADRIFAFMDRQPRVRGNSNSPRLPPHASSIEFRDVCFSYEQGRPILTNVHLDVRHGETIALVGKNGCGKTTLVGLIPRFYDPDHGFILVDGHDIRTVNLRSLRQQIGLVSQETTLFDDTIYNNIAYGNRRAGQADIEAAAERAFAHDFIRELPHGYRTRIGEAGSKLSGGQKQRLALARAILRDPRILILDEFTSQSDVESEALIHKTLRDFMQNRTTFVITHRLNTLEIANRIVMVENGRIAAVGTHQELLSSCPEYQRLHQAQFQRLCA